jgi:uncharacterized membrane protein
MELEHSQTYITKAAPIRPQRIVSVDLLRGLAMMLMALDHTRDYFSGLPFPPEDLNHTARVPISRSLEARPSAKYRVSFGPAAYG